jgi:hypothetical protein
VIIVTDRLDIESYFADVVQCRNPECRGHRLLPWNEAGTEGPYPRGFYCKDYLPKPVLIIAINPGSPDDNQNKLTKDNDNLVSSTHDYTLKLFHDPRKTFQANLLEAIETIFNIKEDHEHFWDIFAFTNLVKCSSEKNFSSLPLADQIHLAKQCYKKHLQREIARINPEMIFTYSKNAFLFLSFLMNKEIIDLPRIPSASSRNQERRTKWLASLSDLSVKLKPKTDLIKQKIFERCEAIVPCL